MRESSRAGITQTNTGQLWCWRMQSSNGDSRSRLPGFVGGESCSTLFKLHSYHRSTESDGLWRAGRDSYCYLSKPAVFLLRAVGEEEWKGGDHVFELEVDGK